MVRIMVYNDANGRAHRLDTTRSKTGLRPLRSIPSLVMIAPWLGFIVFVIVFGLLEGRFPIEQIQP